MRWVSFNWKGIPTKEFKQDTKLDMELKQAWKKKDVQTINLHTVFTSDKLKAKDDKNKIFFFQTK